VAAKKTSPDKGKKSSKKQSAGKTKPAKKKPASSPRASGKRTRPSATSGKSAKKTETNSSATLKQILIDAISKALPEELRAARLPLEYSREEKFGDYALTAAMDKEFREIASRLDPALKNPREAGAHLLKFLSDPGIGTIFQKVEIAGPGFINLTVSSNVLSDFVFSAVKNPERYGRTNSTKPRKIIFEYVSANPTGPLNVVSARAAALGDSCCNLLQWSGQSVFREFYVNDFGNQVQLLGQSCFLRALEAQGIPVKFSSKVDDKPVYSDDPGLPFPSEGYHGEIISDVVREIIKRGTVLIDTKVIEHGSSLAKSNNVPSDFIAHNQGMRELSEKLGEAAVSFFLETQERDLKGFRVTFDSFFRESSLHKQNKVISARDFLTDYTTTEENGKQLFQSTKFGDDQDRVIMREDGRPTYLLADIAYHRTKMDRGFDEIINIWGPDHHGYIKRLAGSLAAMGYPASAFRVLIAQQVNLLEHGKPFVMSKRAGKFITMETLMEEIPIDVLRYFFVMRSFEAHLDFDFAEATDTSEKNPYYYVAYAHARIRSIARKAIERGITTIQDSDEFNTIFSAMEWTPDRRRLLYLVARFPEEVQDAARVLEPHRMINYLYNLATALSRFYAPRENRIIEQTPETARGLLTLLESVAICLKNGLRLLGMDAPDRMVREENEAS